MSITTGGAPSASALVLGTAGAKPEATSGGWLSFAWKAKTMLAGADLIAVVMAMMLAEFATTGDLLRLQSSIHVMRLAAVSLPGWIGVLARYRLYNVRAIGSRLGEARRIAHACGVSVCVMTALTYLFRLNGSRAWF